MASQEQLFEQVRVSYPGTKRGFETEFRNFKKHKDWQQVLPDLFTILEGQKKYKASLSGFVPSWPMFRTWINQRRWEDEYNNSTDLKTISYGQYETFK